jgi:hypothetical protein
VSSRIRFAERCSSTGLVESAIVLRVLQSVLLRVNLAEYGCEQDRRAHPPDDVNERIYFQLQHLDSTQAAATGTAEGNPLSAGIKVGPSVPI